MTNGARRANAGYLATMNDDLCRMTEQYGSAPGSDFTNGMP